MANNLLVDSLTEPLNGATSAKLDIRTESGNLTVNPLTGGESVLAIGKLEYPEGQEPPRRSVSIDNGRATLELKGGSARKPWFHLPWASCNGAFEWQIHLNPTVASDITAYSAGGNVKLDLAGMAITRVSATTGGGNLDVVLPDNAANLDVLAETGGGNVTLEIGSGMTGNNAINAGSGAGSVVVRVPSGIAAKIDATSGMGKVIVDPRFKKIDRNWYQSPDYEGSANKVELKVHTGAGNVSIHSR